MAARPGLVIAYAVGTAEDPSVGGHRDFLADVRSVAASVDRFVLPLQADEVVAVALAVTSHSSACRDRSGGTGLPHGAASGRYPRARQPRGGVRGGVGKVSDEDRRQVLALLAPGSELREGIERIIRSGRGALIVIAWTPEVEPWCPAGS
jgi:hypothetical protein